MSFSLAEFLQRPSVLVCLVVVTALIVNNYFKKRVVYDGIPWVGPRDGWFARVRANWQGLVNPLPLYEEGYEKYSKNNLPFLVPHMFEGARLILPQSQISNILAVPDKDIGLREMHCEMMSTEYTMIDPMMTWRPAHEEVLRNGLTRHLGEITEDIVEEIAISFEKFWGTNTEEWVEVNIFETLHQVVARTSNRVFVGAPLCRNDDYLNNLNSFSNDIVIFGNLIRQLPRFLRPLLGPILTIPNRLHFGRIAKHTKPLIIERLNEMQTPSTQEKGARKNDYIQWALEEAAGNPAHQAELDPTTQALRMAIVSFAALHTSSIAMTHCLVDILGSPDPHLTLEAIAAESQAILDAGDGKWSRQGISKMLRADSAIRESQRLHSFLIAVQRLVLKKGGVTLPGANPGDPDIFLPEGASIAVPALHIMRDDENYNAGAWRYDPFRFSRQREDFAASQSKDAQDTLDHKNMSMVTTSPQHLAFGHGRHGCPGRFFAANELKLLLTHIAMNYDIKPIDEPQEEREKKLFIVSGMCAPDMTRKIWVRRRKVSEKTGNGSANGKA